MKEDSTNNNNKNEETAKPVNDNANEAGMSLSKVIEEQATEGEAPLSRTFSLRKVLGGDILNTSFMRQQVLLFLLISLFMVIYIANRYSCQQDIIEIDALQKELKDAKYKALSSDSKPQHLNPTTHNRHRPKTMTNATRSALCPHS